MHPLAGDFTTVLLGILLHHPGQLLLQPARQIDAEIPLQNMGYTALAGLGVDTHNLFVAAPHVGRIDG